jgi:hypothetical protein
MAIAAPFLILLLLGTTDIVRYATTASKIDRLSGQLADLLARTDRLVDDPACVQSHCTGMIFRAAREIALPVDIAAGGQVILTALADPVGAPPRVAWQRRAPDFALEVDSAFGAEGEAPSLPGDFTLDDGRTAVAVEVVYEFRPFPLSGDLLFSTPAFTTRIARAAIYAPRFTALDTLVPPEGG